MYITSNIHLDQQYSKIQRDKLETWHAFLRRIHSVTEFRVIGGVFLTILILFPLGKKAAQDQLRCIGLVNHTDMVPALKRKYKDNQNPRISVWEFSSQGIPLKTREDKQAAEQIPKDARGRFLLHDGALSRPIGSMTPICN